MSLDINKIHDVNPPDEPDELTRKGIQDFDLARLKNEIEQRETDHEHKKQSFAFSKSLAKWIFGFVIVWMIAVMVFLIWQSSLLPQARLSNPVLVTMLSTTTVNVISLLYLISKYLFHYHLKIGEK